MYGWKIAYWSKYVLQPNRFCLSRDNWTKYHNATITVTVDVYYSEKKTPTIKDQQKDITKMQERKLTTTITLRSDIIQTFNGRLTGR